MSTFRPPPAFAAWQHVDARQGFEVAFLQPDGSGWQVDGHTAALEDGVAWAFSYTITVDGEWVTRRAEVTGRSAHGQQHLTLDSDGNGGWRIDGVAAPHLDGCVDVDLESSAFTNALPVRRLALDVGQGAEAPAVYVRALDLGVERLEQRYMRTSDQDGHQRFDYRAPRFEFQALLVYDKHGLALDYRGLAVRAA